MGTATSVFLEIFSTFSEQLFHSALPDSCFFTVCLFNKDALHIYCFSFEIFEHFVCRVLTLEKEFKRFIGFIVQKILFPVS